MSLYNVNTLTAQSYDMVNPTNSNPQPFTDNSGATFRGPHDVPTPPNPMKGGYTYKKGRRSLRSRNSKRTKRNASVSSVLGMDVSYRGRSGGSKRRRRSASRRAFASKSRSVGMTLARGMAGGRRRRSARRMAGGLAEFPTGYSTPINLSHYLSALANPVPYQPIQV